MSGLRLDYDPRVVGCGSIEVFQSVMEEDNEADGLLNRMAALPEVVLLEGLATNSESMLSPMAGSSNLKQLLGNWHRIEF